MHDHLPARRRRATWVTRWRDDTGSAALEAVLVTPLLIGLLVFVGVVVYRGVDARLRLDDAAHQAARAASLTRSAPVAAAVAHSIAATALSEAGVNCLSVGVDTGGDFVPGGIVTVTVTCAVNLTGAALLAVPSTRSLSATATEPIDVYRSMAIGGGS